MNTAIAIDMMGADHGLTELVPAVVRMYHEYPAYRFVLVGDAELLQQELKKNSVQTDARLRIEAAEEVVEMQDSVIAALRKKRSSMRLALELLQTGEVTACISSGNTGALVANSRSVLSMLPGIDAPAICAALPGLAGDTLMLDLGAIIDARVEQLLQFAVMGTELAISLNGKENPSVGVLNIGKEAIKGNSRVKEVARLLADSTLNYYGYVEGTDLYTGEVDVVVCDGFIGNIALKASEGVAHVIKQKLISEYKRSLYTRLLAVLSRPLLRRLQEEFDARNYNGATLLGLRGVVVKSHGGADRVAFAAAIRRAILEAENNLPEHISERLATYDWMWQ